MLFVFKAWEHALWSHITENSIAGGFLDRRMIVMKCEHQSAESRRPDSSESFGALDTDVWIFFLRDSFNKHEFTLRAEVGDGKQGTVPHWPIFIKQAIIEEWQHALRFQISDLICVVCCFLTKNVERGYRRFSNFCFFIRCNFEEHLDHEVNRRIANIGER